MRYAERQEKGRLLCWKLAEAVANIAPRGISRWDRAWQIVDGPGAEYMVALISWETNPSDAAALQVSDAYDAVIAAWRVAVAECATERSGAE